MWERANVIILSNIINYTGVTGQTISGITIQGNTSRCITLTSCADIHITQCRLINSTDEGIYLFNCSNITIDYNFFSNLSTGVEAAGTPSLGGIQVNFNQFTNMLGPLPRGQFVQFDNINGPNCSICNNIGENIYYQSYPEDAINIYESNGTSGSPILVNDNWIRGGGPSPTGGGILLGDAGGSYQTATGNTLVNPGQYGMGMASGTDLIIDSNQIFAAENVFTNVGITIWNQYGTTCAMNTISNNLVNWTNSAGSPNGSYDNGNCGTVAGWGSNNFSDGSITASILPAQIITYN